MKVTAVFLSAFCAAALGIPVGQDVIHERRAIDSAFVKGTAAAADTVVPVRIALKQRNLEKGMQLLMDISDPDSPNYGKHYTQEQVTELFAPEQGSLETVQKWLKDAGISATVPKSKGWVDFTTTVSKLESLLQTSYHTYKFAATGSSHIGTDSYKLPADVSKLVDFVAPGVVTSKMVAPVKPQSTNERPGRPVPITPLDSALVKKLTDAKFAAANCGTSITPECIKNQYNISDATLKDPRNRMGMFESAGEMHKQSDLNLFFSKYATKIPKGTGPKIDFIDFNGKNPDGSEAVGEAALDFDIAYPIIYPQNLELYQTNSNFNPSNGTVGFFNQFLDAIDGSYCTSSSHGQTGDDPVVDGNTPNESCGDFKPANTISVSYGWEESAFPANYLLRQCDEFMKLGLQGSSVFIASGDGGVAGGHGGQCLGDSRNIFNPVSPAGCPYVTAVGATVLGSDGKESATESFASGGGFSNVYPTPDYQKDAVNSFFTSHNPSFQGYNTTDGNIPKTGGVYNRAGRGYPDIAALGDNGVIAFNGQISKTGGTSMSAPLVAAIFNRINDERLAAGKKVLGFVNPAIYKNTKIWTDVTSGDQSSGGGFCAGKGFSAVSGWDPVTGLGTPNYPALLDYLKNL